MQLTGGRLAAVTIGGPLLVCAVGFNAFDMTGTFARASEHHAVSYPWSGGTVSVDVNSGSVRIVVGASDTVGVAYTEHYQLKKPTVTGAASASGLTLHGACPGGPLGNNCAVNYELTVPASAAISVSGGSGSISVADTTGAVSIHTGDGTVSLDRISGDVVAHTGNGSVRATAIRAVSFQATAGDGSVHVDWATPPKTVVATTGNGSIHLTVPKGSGRYQVEANTGLGSQHVSVPTDPTATATITARSGDGSVTVDTAS